VQHVDGGAARAAERLLHRRGHLRAGRDDVRSRLAGARGRAVHRRLLARRYGRDGRPVRGEGYSALVCATLLWAVGGCGNETAEPSRAERGVQARQPVIGGVPSGAERDAVLLMLAEGPDRATLCTATLIAPNLVVTARHCISVYVEGTFFCTIEGNLDLHRPRNPPNAGEMGFAYPAEVISFHAGQVPDFDVPTTMGKRVFVQDTDTICRNDIAFVLLEDDLDLPIAPVRLDRGTFPGEATLVVGYGLNETRENTRHERADVEILDVGPSDYFPALGNALPRTFVVGPSACAGDSGGPGLSQETGAVLGVSSLTRGECESSEVRSFFTQIAPYEALAREAFAAAGHEPRLEGSDEEPEPTPGGLTGGAGAEGAGAEPPSSGAGTTDAGCTLSPTLGTSASGWAAALG